MQPRQPEWPKSARSQMRPGNDRIARLLLTAILVAACGGAGAFLGGASTPKRGYRERDPQTGQVVTFRDSPEKARRRLMTGGIIGAILGAVIATNWWREPLTLDAPHETPRYPGQWRSGRPGD